jgi:hypothetical protein
MSGANRNQPSASPSSLPFHSLHSSSLQSLQPESSSSFPSSLPCIPLVQPTSLFLNLLLRPLFMHNPNRNPPCFSIQLLTSIHAYPRLAQSRLQAGESMGPFPVIGLSTRVTLPRGPPHLLRGPRCVVLNNRPSRITNDFHRSPFLRRLRLLSTLRGAK